MDNMIRKKSKRAVKNTPQTTWIFDLDNTLYPEHCNLFSRIDVQMKAFISDLLGVDDDTAYKVQKDYFVRFGTTLKGLMEMHGVDPEDFLHFVHDIDLSSLEKDEPLNHHLSKIKGRKLVFTNGDARYATRVLEKIGIQDQFEGIFDINSAGHVPKPNHASYQNFIDHFDVDPKTSIMFEDMARNLTPASNLGMTTVLIKTNYQWSKMDYNPEHIDYETSHLVGWLEENL